MLFFRVGTFVSLGGDAGPGDLLEVLSLPVNMFRQMQVSHPLRARLLGNALEEGTIMSTSYSGLGTAEIASHMLASGWKGACDSRDHQSAT